MANLLIFDFDGVVADSEVIVSTVLVEVLAEMGVELTLQASYDRFLGKRMQDVVAAVEAVLGEQLPCTFLDDFTARTSDSLRRELREVEGVSKFIATVPDVRKCVASSSAPDYLDMCLELLELSAVFQPHVFSASLLERGKPHPDIFLHAAGEMGVSPSNTVVIEDSTSGVMAGVAAGMTVIGLLAGSHIQPGHDAALRTAGAHHLAHDFDEVAAVVSNLLTA